MANLLDLKLMRIGKGDTGLGVTGSSVSQEIKNVTSLGSVRAGDVYEGVGQTRYTTSIKGTPEEQMVDLLKQIAAATPAYPNIFGLRLEGAKGEPSRPAVTRDARRGEPRIDLEILQGRFAGTKTLRDINQKDYGGAFKLWADTPHLDAWKSPFGQAFAQYSLHRYALGDEVKETVGKIGHASAVTWYSRSLFLDQQAEFQKKGLGELLDADWSRRLDFAGVAHDVGYMHGGRNHPSKGAADMLANFGEYAKNAGLLPDNSPAQQVEIEKIAVLAQMHGMSFPWDQIDQRLPGDHYISVDVVESIFKNVVPGKGKTGVELLKEIVRGEYAEYLSAPALEGQPKKFAWLDDPKEMTALIRGGWIMHCADKDLGPRPSNGGLAGVKKAIANDAVPGRLGNERPLTSLAALDNFFRNRALDRQVGSGRLAGDLADKLAILNKAILDGVADLSGSARALADSIKKDQPSKGTPKLPTWAPEVLSLANKLKAYAKIVGDGFGHSGGSAPFGSMKGSDIVAKLKTPGEDLAAAIASSKIPAFIMDDLLETGRFSRELSRDLDGLRRAPDPS
jgi:hypothetical protein